MNELPNKAMTSVCKVLAIAILGFLFCTTAATYSYAQDAPAPRADEVLSQILDTLTRNGQATGVIRHQDPAIIYRPHNPAAAWSIRNNLAYDATGTMNLSVEFALGRHASLGGTFGLKPWDRFFFWDHDEALVKKWRHLSVVPEFRYYLSEVSRGHFFGANLLWLHYNAAGLNFPWGVYPAVRDQRLQGDLFGGGLFYGYAFPLGRHWRIEALLGVAGGWYSYDSFRCESCGTATGSRTGAALLPNVGVNVVYTFNKKEKNN